MATITFHGAAQEVTGSCHMLESKNFGRILLDCGMQQGEDVEERTTEDHFDFDPASVQAVVLSHAHLDHSGLLPQLVHEGFSGPIHCTAASADLLDIMLKDAWGLYERDLTHQNTRRARRGEAPLQPSYTMADVDQALAQCAAHRYGEKFSLASDTDCTFHDAGHILGSAITEINIRELGASKTLVFSGDLGKKDAVLMNDPARLSEADVVLMESTYGDRNHRSMDNTVEQLKHILQDRWKSGGNVLIPAFAVGRTQELLFYLGQLHHQGELDEWQIFVDSPMAISVTKVYDRWFNILDSKDVRPLSSHHETLLKGFLPRLNLTVTPEESMAINDVKKGAIIIAGSGMCTGGRIRHHFKQRIWKENNTLLFVGFQAHGTLGRILVDGVKRIKLFGDYFAVKAQVETLGGFSAHAGRDELIEWAANFSNSPRFALVHGEPQAIDALAHSLWQEHRIRALTPHRGDSMVF